MQRGLPAYKGLNLARADWPSTRMTPGATFTLSYSSTIPHTGTFKLYLSKPGYDPTKPLKWSDLPTKPFATATDPALVNGAYRIKATLPSDRTGRQMLYTIWQNTSTSDTYYSCSDVVFPTASGGGAAAPTTSSPARTTPTANRTAQRSQEPTATTATPGDRSPSPAPETTAATTEVTAPDHLAPAADSSSGGSNTLPLVAGAGERSRSCSPRASPSRCDAVGDRSSESGQLTVTAGLPDWVVSETGAYFAVK